MKVSKYFNLISFNHRDRAGPGPRPRVFLYPESRHFLAILVFSCTTDLRFGPGQ
uniref:Uncharacterized protein n=1 Tax=Meloidogyne enterolobii TaxID=390850 RepID=A0A6V7WIP0_MELEN|nr:unnamed protein product [Meloidogyne enterolobii]